MLTSRKGYIYRFIITISLLLLSIIGIRTGCCSDIKDLIPFFIYPISIISTIIFGIILITLLVGFFYTKEITYGYTPLFRLESAYKRIPEEKLLTSPNNNLQDTKNSRNRCIYHAKYYDLQKRELVDFQCLEEVSKGELCIFHNRFKIKENVLDNTINEKVNRMIDDNQEVFCIGYKIPILILRGKVINKPIHFHEASIKIADFTDSVFATEETIAYFINTNFEEASFENVQFHGKAIFTNSIFMRESTREGYLHKWREDYHLEYRYSCYANFSNVEFYDEANFYRVKFFGLVQFDNAKFFDVAEFAETEFHVEERKLPFDNAQFHGTFYNERIWIEDDGIPSE